MGKSQPTYPKEFKQQAVQLFETSGKNKTQIVRDRRSPNLLQNSLENISAFASPETGTTAN